MKIALITIHNANNYGAILQAFATKQILSKYGEINTINYDNHFSYHLDWIRFLPSVHGIKMFAHDLLRLPFRISAVRKFKSFIRDNMNLTPKLKSEQLSQGIADYFDAYVCGSDQIWNPEIVNSTKTIDPIYFLSFAPQGARKLSYASSIGNYHYTEEEKKQVKQLLNDFTIISTRESDGLTKLSDILPEKEIYHVLDPTLLLSKEEWFEALRIDSAKPKEEYILVYSVPRTALLKKAVKYFASKLNYKIIVIDQMLFPVIKGNKHIRSAGPKEFVELFSKAALVITDSFHGVCFAVNCEKPFIAISAGKKSNRIQSLLSVLEISEKFIGTESELEVFDFKLDVTTASKENLLKQRMSSLALLDTALVSNKINLSEK